MNGERASSARMRMSALLLVVVVPSRPAPPAGSAHASAAVRTYTRVQMLNVGSGFSD